jgi:nucleoid-associated protein YgaU
VFKWGPLQFSGVVTDVKQKYTMFLESGKPVRATVDVTFQSVLDPVLSRKMSPWESPDRTKYRILDESSSLWQLAYEEYGDADYWKVIAKANGIRNPLNITAGMEVVLPPIHP